MNWVTLVISLVPELVRGIISICKDNYAAKKAEAEAKKAEAERKKLEMQEK